METIKQCNSVCHLALLKNDDLSSIYSPIKNYMKLKAINFLIKFYKVYMRVSGSSDLN